MDTMDGTGGHPPLKLLYSCFQSTYFLSKIPYFQIF